ncbi:BatA and WFA domain-containing protein [Candidatus Woesearchaeota archaeon]|nr:BatA and WFA domain-containing protein [Candidatus Woesearchaeota archaeon]
MDWLTTAANFFLEPNWLYEVNLIFIFILLYLIRPKPKQKVIPSLMFLFKDLGRDKKMTFFRKLVQNLLFWLQFFALLLLLLAAAKPYVSVAKESLFKNTVIVLDVSSSMKADYKGETRFEDAVEIAKKNLGVINTLVLAKKTPEVVLIEESSSKVRDYLNKLKAADTPTNLYEAISTAGSYARSEARVVVISDFIDTETDTGLNTAKKTLEAQGIKVDFIKVFEPVPNIGIVDLVIDNEKTSAVVRNYNAEQVSISIKVNSLEESLTIPPDSQELFTFSTPPGTSKIELELKGIKDGFKADNVAYLSTPSDVKKKVLLITNNPNYQKTYLFNAFDVMKKVEIETAIPPKIPDLKNYDVFIFKDINPNLILPGTFTGVKKEVEEKGKASIIAAQTDLLSVNYYSLTPIWANETKALSTNIITGSSESLTSNIEFGITKKYFSIHPNYGINLIIIAAAEDNTPIITFNALGNGKLFFYGILDEDKQADTIFAKSPAYFVFWKRVVDFATNTPSIKNLNYKTGSALHFSEEQNIQTPDGRITTKSLSLDDAGLYTLNDRTIAINLLDDKESDVSKEAKLDQAGFSQSSERFKEKVPYELTDYFIILSIILLFAEFIYIKFRGDV